MIISKQGIVETLSANREQIQALGVKRLRLFGSFARGDQTDSSDVDVLVEFEPGKKTFDTFMGLCFVLEETLGRRVEIVTPESLSPHIGPRILKEVEYVAFAA